jgi:hypothetical protein
MNLSHHRIFNEGFAAISEECGPQLTNYIQTTALLCIMLLAFSESIFEAAFGIGGKDEGRSPHEKAVLHQTYYS